MKTSYFPAEWEQQSAIQIAWPTMRSDWKSNFLEAEVCYIQLARTIVARQKLIIVGNDKQRILDHFTAQELKNIVFVALEYNDTWVRDSGGITVIENRVPIVLDYQFNAWGNKFESAKDNLITEHLLDKGIVRSRSRNCNDFVLEGGALESNGAGVLLTTSKCIFNENRNPTLSKHQILERLKKDLFVQKIICLNHGKIAGDDTDAHIDTLARFVNENTIVYLKCENEFYPFYEELQKMEKELKEATNLCGEPFDLIPIKMATNVKDKDGRLLPSTHVNFLIINDAVLVPTYQVSEDKEALSMIQEAIPTREVVGINCLSLIQQNGSLHCATMQFPKSVKISGNI